MLLYSDGAYNRFTTPAAWASVVDENEKDCIGPYAAQVCTDLVTKETHMLGKKKKQVRTVCLSTFLNIKTQQNNGAELIALLVALRIAKLNSTITEIRCDSDLLVKYWTINGPNPTTAKTMDPAKLAFIQEAIALRKEFEARGGTIVKIAGKDNLADLGLH